MFGGGIKPRPDIQKKQSGNLPQKGGPSVVLHIFLTALITALVVAFVAFLLVRAMKDAFRLRISEEKRDLAFAKFEEGRAHERSQKWFGLQEALAVAKFVKNQDGANAVLGTVGVLGYKNTVSGDAEQEIKALFGATKVCDANIARANEEIDRLNAVIRSERERIVVLNREAKDTQRLIDLFSAPEVPTVSEKPAEPMDEEG